MSDENKPENLNVNAEGSSIAVGGISIGGDVSGNIHIGHTTGYTQKEVSVILEQISFTFQPKPFDGRCPYKGLDVFEEEDAELFFGREKLVDDLVGRVKGSRTVFVTGPSGSGKSSLVRAGLIHALKQGAIKNSERWLFATMKPGRDPIGELGRVASNLADSTNAEDEIRAKAIGDGTIFARWCEIALKEGRDKRVLLFIDQFEEVFTQINNEAERVAFLNLLTHAAMVENGRVIILFSMRSDFVSNCATYPQINALLNQQFIQIGAMQPEELVSAIAQPALRVGLRIDPDLIAQIISDMEGEPGTLPLMQFALKELFDAGQAKGGLIALTLRDYLERKGIQEMLGRHADDTFNKLSENEQGLARSIFSGLIEIGRGMQDTKRTALFDELIPADANTGDVEAIVQKLADARLITTDEAAGRDTVTISHEKLIEAWPWLKRLVDENRDVIALQNEIASDAQEWEDHKRESSYLYSGAHLGLAQEQVTGQKITLNGLAKAFFEEGIRAREAERKSKELLRRRITFGLVAGIAIAFVLAGFAVYQMLQAQKQATISRSQALAANSQLQSPRIRLSLLLALEAFDVAANLAHSERILSEQAVRDSLRRISGIPLVGHESSVAKLAFSPDERWLATASKATTFLWDINDLTAEPIILTGNEYSISTLAFSPDGHWLAIGVADFTVHLRDMNRPTADPIILSGHEDVFFTMAFSPDGHWLATGSQDHTAHVWNMNDLTADPIILRGHEGSILTLAFSPDGHWLATGSWDTTARLWDMNEPTSDPITLLGHVDKVSILAFSPDGDWLATGSEDHTARLWNMNKPTADPVVLEGHKYFVSSLAFSPDERWLATGSEDATVRLWDINDLTAEPIILTGNEYSISTLAFSPDGHWLAIGVADFTVHLRDMNWPTADPIILSGHEDVFFTMAFSPDGHWLATGSWDTTARLWDMNKPTAEATILDGHEDTIVTMAFSPDGHWLATGSWDTTARLWDMNEPTAEPIVLRGHGKIIHALSFSPNGRWLATGSEDHTARLWDMNEPTSDPITLLGHTDAIHALTISPDGHWLATGSEDHSARLWDMNKLTADPVILNGHEGEVFILGFSPDGRWLATGSRDATIRLWDMNQLTADSIVLRGYEYFLSSLAFSPDGHWLAGAGSDKTFNNTLHLWDMNNLTAQPVSLRGLDNSIFTMVFSPDGRWLAAGSSNTAWVWDMNRPTSDPITLRGHIDYIHMLALAFSPDGQWLATGGGDYTVRLWEMSEPAADPVILRGHGNIIHALSFSPNGRRLATGSQDTTVRLWDVHIDELLVEACRFIGRNFTRAEWSQYFPNEEYRKTCEQWQLEPEAMSTATPD